MLAALAQAVPQVQQAANLAQISLRDWIEIAAIFLGPIVALFLQRQLDEWRERKKEKFRLYSTLMRLRAVRLTPEYVNALNLIDVVFNKKKGPEKVIRDKLLTLVEHYYKDPSSADWQDRVTDLTVDLLTVMGEYLGYEFDPSHIKRNVYSPQVQVTQFQEQEALRKLLLDVLGGRRRIGVAVFKEDFPETK